jgi:hypothetical protein
MKMYLDGFIKGLIGVGVFIAMAWLGMVFGFDHAVVFAASFGATCIQYGLNNKKLVSGLMSVGFVAMVVLSIGGWMGVFVMSMIATFGATMTGGKKNAKH